ncbi:MAG: hypothetical protein ACKO23_07825, partial [Gemmataceae bacterium]
NVTGKNEWLADIVLANSATVAAQAGTTLTLSGDISDLGGANPQSNLTMRSTGKLVLSGNNTYRGNTIIPMGNVQVDGTIGNVQMVQGNWNGQVIRGVLRGAGTVGQINSSAARAIGTIAPGANGTATPTGILKSASAIWGQSTTFSVQLNGPTAGTNYDQLLVNGNIDLGGARLGVSAVPSLPVGSSYTIIQVVGGTRTGTFAGLANNAVVMLGGLRFRINYTTTTVVLTRV